MNNENTTDTKIIHLSNNNSKIRNCGNCNGTDNNNNTNNKKSKNTKNNIIRPRVIVQSSSWNLHIVQNNITLNNQYDILSSIVNKQTVADANTDMVGIDTNIESKTEHFLIQQIITKINSYKRQDYLKNRYNADHFITLPYVCALLLKSNLDCCFCFQKVYLWYDNFREPLQWTLDRVDNSIGHNIDNVEIACLFCNLKRKTMNNIKYLKSKQTKCIIKLDHTT